ncbi:uncharacterized protein Z518_01928 [Rhinocladiella mackenziei CBS 650.93]|uniref:Anaphase-promoting complex subunit 4 n=1 Tax=Rhinocladiella mackenziei CBS 650.93 TaxID=1442369 RepID=A0A0D2JDL3_9EURO|nr:uncharacterized protein Z518_01928 [Rhinocladiella mackenziei CBS 650.93]KIX07275.1 hypothetical protein Z518_01928 [Rhinocladiella mackenziei CBS 650.93]
MDLIATVSEKDTVDLWRLNGQRVLGASFVRENTDMEGAQMGGGFVKALAWRRDGQILAVACADGTVSLINTFTGKTAHRLSTHLPASASASAGSSFASSQSRSPMRSSKRPKWAAQSSSLQAPPSTVSTISWTTHFAFPAASAIRSRLDAPDSKISLDHILGLRADVDKLLQLKVDLPRELTGIDVEISLPRLATLPPRGVGVDDDVFSSRGSVDAVFHGAGSTGSAGGPGAGGVDALLVGLQSDGDDDVGGCGVHLRIFDSFEIGAVDLSGCLPPGFQSVRVLRIESHPLLSTVFLIVEQSRQDQGGSSSQHLLSLDLSFIPQTSRNLPLGARKATQLGNLIRYISQVQTQLASEVKAAFDLPAKFLRNINESLAEEDENADFVYAAHHLAVTGDCDPRLKEWLVDEVGERGLKRWEKTVGDCLDVVRRMTGECLLPALERCLVVLSRLGGLARFGVTSSRLGLDEKRVSGVRETVDALGILGEDLLIDVGVEIKEFTAFIKWLKWECEVEALEEGSEKAEELRESWTGEGELRTVLDYVGGAMKETRLKRYIGDGSATGPDKDADVGFYADFTTRRANGNKDKRMPTLGELVERMQKQCDAVFAQIAENFRKSILATYVSQLPGSGGGNLDVRIIPDENDVNLYRLFTLSKDQREKGALRQAWVTLRQDGGKSLKFTTSGSITPKIDDVEEILDAKFVDDTVFLLLAATTKADVRIYSYIVTTEIEDQVWDLRHIFEEGRMDAGMKPARLDVNGRVGRRVVTVVDDAGMGYVVLDLDADVDVDGGDEVMTG